MFECVYIYMQTSIITVSLDKSTLTKGLYGYSRAFPDFHIVSRSAPPTEGQSWKLRKSESCPKITPYAKRILLYMKMLSFFVWHDFWILGIP